MDNSNIYGLAPELDSPTLSNIVQENRYQLVILQNITWVISITGIRSEEYEVANAWRKDIHFRGWEINPTVSGTYPFSEISRGPVVKGIAGTSSPKERSSYFIFHLPHC